MASTADSKPRRTSAPARKSTGAARKTSGAARKTTGSARSRTTAKPPHLSPAERAERGKAARAQVPRSEHAKWEPAPDRPDPIALLEEQATSRVPELVPIRYGRMSASPFAFYRGAALVMASDLSHTPTSGITVQACGDAHMTNFGVFGTPERRLVFDINDFDETLPGPWEWDLKRLVASLAVAARDLQFSERVRRAVLLDTAEAYRGAMQQFATMNDMDVWYVHLDVDTLSAQIKVQRETRRRLEAGLEKARTKDATRALEKLTHLVGGQPRIISDPPLVVPIEELYDDLSRKTILEWLQRLIEDYRKTLSNDRRHLLDRFELVHAARKVVGVGSVGTRAWILLLLGRDEADPLFLQAKEAQPSVLERFNKKCQQTNQGERVVVGQRLMQASSDLFLGWERVMGVDGKNRDYYVRQLQDWKGSVDPARMVPEGMTAYGRLCGWTLARAHARSGDRIAIASYLGNSMTFAEALVEFAERYAEQNLKDYAALQKAISSGRVTAETGI